MLRYVSPVPAQRTIALCPQWSKGYFRAGVAYYKLGQTVEAMDMVRRAGHCDVVLAHVYALSSDLHLTALWHPRVRCAQFELAASLEPSNESIHTAGSECRQRLRLIPLGAVPEINRVYLRPPTPVSRQVLGAGSVFAWGGGSGGCLGLGEVENHLYPKCVDDLRGKYVRRMRLCVRMRPARSYSRHRCQRGACRCDRCTAVARLWILTVALSTSSLLRATATRTRGATTTTSSVVWA